MVTISNGRASRFVTLGAFNSIYKDMGYRIVDGAPKNIENKVPNEEIGGEPDDVIIGGGESEDDWVTELLEKPISQWSKDETAAFAKEKGIDTSSAHKLSEAKDIIKAWLDEQRM